MTRNTFRLAAACVAVLLATASTAWAQKTSEERIQELIRAAAERAGVSLARGGQTPGTTAQPPGSADSRAKVQMTVDDAIKLALDRNLDIAVQRLNPQTFDYSTANLLAVYRPTLTSAIGRQSATTASSQTLNGLPV